MIALPAHEFLLLQACIPLMTLQKIMRRLALAIFALATAHGVVLGSEPPVRFNRDVRPILAAKCFRCHGPDANHREAELRLDEEVAAKQQRSSHSAAILAGNPVESPLWLRIVATDKSIRMPPPSAGKPLTSAEIAILEQWIEEGAHYEGHWSLAILTQPDAPRVENATWPTNDIDRFILAKLEARGLSPSPPADPATLMRRLSFDLIGLPPSSEQIEQFQPIDDPGSYEQIVDTLLASKHFGQRMAMYWLDLVRYANSVGYHGDQEHAITPYRDWVIKAFNDNMRFDQFTIEQLAGDLLPDASINQKIASGYNRLHQTSHEGGVQIAEYLHKYDADRIRNFSSVWLATTLGCCECHDHKYDPFSQKDFYQLVAFFADIDDYRSFRGGDSSPTKRDPELEVPSPADGKIRRTMVTEALAQPRTIRILERGSFLEEIGEPLAPAVPQVFPPLHIDAQRPTRLDLARWLTNKEHPQTARVFVNRLWYLFFGTGLSRTLQDFGSQGAWPTHPELLDHLALEFIASGWNVKHVIKQLVMSQAYRQASLETAEQQSHDPENRLFGRQSRWRLPAEMIRDNALSVSGLLRDESDGSSARPYQPAGYYRQLNFPQRTYQADMDAGQYRRGVYIHWQRQFLHPMLRAFDAPSREECTAERPISNTPLSSLVLLNDPTFFEAARMLAQTTLLETNGSENNGSDESRFAWMWKHSVSRLPNPQELKTLQNLLDQNRQVYQQNPAAARAIIEVGLAPSSDSVDTVELASWTAIARAVLNLDEFITRN